jgi:hypothetical protein
MAIKKRVKASDFWSEPVTDALAPRQLWRDVYPQIETMRLEVRQGRGIRAPVAVPQIITETSTYQRFIDCRNPLCAHGGMDIARHVHAAVSKRAHELEACEACCGYEGSPKGERRYGPCLTEFQLKGTVGYR